MDDEQYVNAYRFCITRQFPLPQELVDWFYDKADSVLAMDRADQVLSVIRRYGLSFSPERWAEILKDEEKASSNG